MIAKYKSVLVIPAGFRKLLSGEVVHRGDYSLFEYDKPPIWKQMTNEPIVGDRFNTRYGGTMIRKYK